MILPKDWRVTIEPLEGGVRVRVAHLPTGKMLEEQVPRGGRVGQVERALSARLHAQFYTWSDYEKRQARAEGGAAYELVSRVTGKRGRRFVPHGQKAPSDIWLQLLDELLEAEWAAILTPSRGLMVRVVFEELVVDSAPMERFRFDASPPTGVLEVDTEDDERVSIVFEGVVGFRYVPSACFDRRTIYVEGEYRPTVLLVEPSEWVREVVSAHEAQGEPLGSPLHHYVVPSDDGVWELLAVRCVLTAPESRCAS